MDPVFKILVVDDEKDLSKILNFNLSSEGFEIDAVASAEEALSLTLQKYSLILLDVMMPGMSGYKMADIIRKERKLELPIIFLTAKGAENEMLTGFNVGGDDYIRKPFSIKEVVVRIRAVMKRMDSPSKKVKQIIYKGLKLDVDKKAVSIDQREIDLTRKEFKILSLLIENKDRYITRDEIMDEVWNKDVVVTDRNVDVNIARLRKKMGDYGTFIKGKTGYGYCFQDEGS